jgi:hypothetical protein
LKVKAAELNEGLHFWDAMLSGLLKVKEEQDNRLFLKSK